MELNTLLETAITKRASDLHLSVALPPIVRIDGELVALPDSPLDELELSQLLKNSMTEKQQVLFSEKLELDYAYALAENHRFRVNAFHQQRGKAAVFRIIPNDVPTLESLGFKEPFESLCQLENGLVLVTGPTGSGKSTTLAAMVDFINSRDQKHILTVEDPIEFTHHSKKSLINQRELHRDTHNFPAALRSALREDPDIILVGELRDLETIRLALTAAETGHLVFATLHTRSAAQTISRVIDVFPAGEKEMVRALLSESLRAVISQTLLKKQGGGRIAAYEVMMNTPAIRHLINENKVPQIYSAMQTGQVHGMHTLEQHLETLRAKQSIV